MMGMLWVVLFVAVCGSHSGYGLPVRPAPQTYPHDGQSNLYGWSGQGGLYAAIPALALVLTAVGLLFGCTWCYRHKDCKPNEGADNQLFTAAASHIHTAQRVQPPDSGFSEPVNNNISEDNNNGPISLREMQNIANNNATAYIVSENEERNRISRESVVEFEPLPAGIGAIGGVDPLERCGDWFGDDDFPRNNLQYLREMGRGWFGRVVEGEIDEAGVTSTVAVKILNQNATLEDKARFLDEAKLYRDLRHENILGFVGRCVREDPWILIFEHCSMDLQQYLIVNRPKMAILNESGVPLRVMCDVTSALAHLHGSGYTYGRLWSGSVLVRGEGEAARAVLGRYETVDPEHDCFAPEVLRRGVVYNANSEIWSLGTLIWEVCSWGSLPTSSPSPPPDLPFPYKSHLYQVMQLCWNMDPSIRPTAAQVHSLVQHLHATHAHARSHAAHSTHSELCDDGEFEDRWERLKPNSIPKLDEHVALVHALCGSRASSAASQASGARRRSASLTNLHGSLEDVCAASPALTERRAERDADNSDSSLDPWLKDIMAGSQDDVSYYRDVSDVIKNLDNILNSEKTSSSESSHQASPSRDNLSLDCKKDYPMQSSLVKSPGISNFQNVLDAGFGDEEEQAETCIDDEMDRETIGTLSHSFERHSDTVSQQTLENLTPDTPMKDMDFASNIVCQEESNHPMEMVAVEIPERVPEMPKNIVNSEIPELKQLCKTILPSLRDCNVDGLIVQKDCATSCDNAELRTDNKQAKSVEDIRDINTDSLDLVKQNTDTDYKEEEEGEILSKTVEASSASNEGVDTLPSITDDVSNITQEDTSQHKLHFDEIETESMKSDHNYSKDETILVSDLNDTITDSSKYQVEDTDQIEIEVEQVPIKEPPVLVQSIKNIQENNHQQLIVETQSDHEPGIEESIKPDTLPPELVQNTNTSTPVCETDNLVDNIASVAENETLDSKENEEQAKSRSDNYVGIELNEHSSSSTVYMDLIMYNHSQELKDSVNNTSEEINDNIKENDTCFNTCADDETFLNKNESTEYLDLPSFDVIKLVDEFIHEEKMISNIHNNDKICASTPITSDNSGDLLENTLENPVKEFDTYMLSETKVPATKRESISSLKSEQIIMSPFDSPSKSLRTDTYDENSSVMLGPFENCAHEAHRSPKPSIDSVELPKEELLAFSSNFSEMNLETPSPLRDARFLNEVPDIISDDMQYDDLASISEPKLEPPSEETPSCHSTEKRVSPSTPPNSPGIFLASTSQQIYIVDIDLNKEDLPPPLPVDPIQDEIDLNQIELQITSKLAMAENENNLNIEYSGPLTVEGLIEEGSIMPESDAIPELYLAGNGNSGDDGNDEISLNEECVQALRNELELKLPLAQVAAIEPQCDEEWAGELPPPHELVISYPGALSPIAEETGQQLSAYENDMQWNASRTESSESYPEPCNNSTCTDAPELEQTYTLQSKDQEHPTYTVQKEIPTANTSREVTMSADSLNASPLKIKKNDPLSPIDDRTYNKDEEKESNCDRISQVSPYLVSPTTDTSAPETSDNFDNPTGVSTLSKTTVPTDAKHSKPSETQCLSKATSIDSWCSNDTLYNVEENFDDLAMDPDLPIEFEKEEGNSESTDTLTHNDDDRELSHCSTYIIHESKSDPCETFSPDSITANDNYTYTKAKTDLAGTTPSIITEHNDSTKNTQTKDLAYGTLMSGLPSCSNCTTELVSGLDEHWKLPQPELVRRSPIGDEMLEITSPKFIEQDLSKNDSVPLIRSEPCVKRLESVEITCLKDQSIDSPKIETENNEQTEAEVNPNYNFRNMAPSMTSTPLVDLEVNDDTVESIPMTFPQADLENTESIVNIPNFQNFQQSAELRPQDLSSNVSTECTPNSEVLLEGDSKVQTRNSTSLIASDRTPTYIDFENSAVTKPQDLNSRDRSSQSAESGISSEDFRQFEDCAKNRPQDLSFLINVSSLLLMNERMSSDGSMSTTNAHEHTSQSSSKIEQTKSLNISPPSNMNLIESQTVDNVAEHSNAFLINFGNEDETEQPHSIIVTEVPLNTSHITPEKTFDSHIEFSNTFDSHENNVLKEELASKTKVNGEIKVNNVENVLITETQNGTVTKDSMRDSDKIEKETSMIDLAAVSKHTPNGIVANQTDRSDIVNGESAKFATVHFLSETFEELIESNVDEGDCKDVEDLPQNDIEEIVKSTSALKSPVTDETIVNQSSPQEEYTENYEDLTNNDLGETTMNGVSEDGEIVAVTEDFLQNEKKYCQLDSYLPLLSDIRFTGPAAEIMSTSFTQDSPTDPTSPSNERDSKPDTAADIMKDWDSDTDSHSSNSSSGEFIWKDGDGHQTSVVPSTQFEHQRNNNSHVGSSSAAYGAGGAHGSGSSGAGSGSGSGSASGSEGDEVEFVPSSWDCRAEPAKSSLRSLEHAHPDSKKRVVFKRQKYHCVYEYPREAPDADPYSPAYLPDLSTYTEWDPTSAEEAELCYGQLFSSPSALSAAYPLRAGVAFSADYDEDFFISSSARPFESLGIMSTTSQFFPGMHVKGGLTSHAPPSPSPPPVATPLTAAVSTLLASRTPSLELTTPDSGVEDITPGSLADEQLVAAPESGAAREPAAPGGALGGLRHTRDRLKLDLPPSPLAPSPRHARVFSFTVEPKRTEPSTPLVMSDDTPLVRSPLALPDDDAPLPLPEPTFSTFGKSAPPREPEQKMILTDSPEDEPAPAPAAAPAPAPAPASPKPLEPVKGEGTVLDSGDEDSGIESSAKATLERNNAHNVK